jgi:hypothetical protein
MKGRNLKRGVNFFLASALALNLALWEGSRDMFAKWAGVPPVPSTVGANMMTLGDSEFSYRSFALTLQNLGDGGGQTTPLKDYDYKKLGKWFWLLNSLDPASEHLPLVAAYYFGAVHDMPQDAAVVVDFLSKIGQNPAGDKWRWLAQAAFLAQHRVKDLHLALDIAYTLSRMQPIGGHPLPSWAREYPAFVLKAQGEKESARKLMETMLLTEENPAEINFIKSFLTEQLKIDPSEVEALMKEKGKK